MPPTTTSYPIVPGRSIPEHLDDHDGRRHLCNDRAVCHASYLPNGRDPAGAGCPIPPITSLPRSAPLPSPTPPPQLFWRRQKKRGVGCVESFLRSASSLHQARSELPLAACSRRDDSANTDRRRAPAPARSYRFIWGGRCNTRHPPSLPREWEPVNGEALTQCSGRRRRVLGGFRRLWTNRWNRDAGDTGFYSDTLPHSLHWLAQRECCSAPIDP